MGYRRRFNDYYERFNGADPVVRIAAIIALAVLVAIVLPFFPLPWVASGNVCTSNAQSKLSGNNQSILGSAASSESLRLEISPQDIQIRAGEPLRFDVRFINDSMAPLMLYITEDRFLFRYIDTEDGLSILLRRTGSVNSPVLGEPIAVRPISAAPQSYDNSQVFRLQPRARCTIPIILMPARLAAAQVTDGEYSIIAVYNNTKRGVLPAVQRLTPTPSFPDQGVWNGRVRSNQAVITIFSTAPTVPSQ